LEVGVSVLSLPFSRLIKSSSNYQENTKQGSCDMLPQAITMSHTQTQRRPSLLKAMGERLKRVQSVILASVFSPSHIVFVICCIDSAAVERHL